MALPPFSKLTETGLSSFSDIEVNLLPYCLNVLGVLDQHRQVKGELTLTSILSAHKALNLLLLSLINLPSPPSSPLTPISFTSFPPPPF